ncbi:glycosyl transferase [Nostoc sp. CENA67]|uniref:Glycosyl transferase n=1 Tax=Amazonocrinis nigriterrae CENA67 TaxID=2794033 RepID=A0A8J7HW60_9NOST|nr:glycosyltransferase [Amazonocrinis nigriterrae]MBH8565425.1 glycosyl transferase [Amazonocrinis nigriterrae CENA67]
MKRLMFYCQHILGMGHLVRSMEIVRGLVKDFHVCFINGGEVVQGFNIPSSVDVVNLPAIKTDSEFKNLQVVDNSYSLEEVKEIRQRKLLQILDEFQPDVLMIELFPFGRRRFSFELIPLLERVRHQYPTTKIVCSLRDIIVNSKNQARHEEKVCNLINQYFDLLLIHGDPKFISLEETFSRVADIECEIHYTGYVVQPQPKEIVIAHQPLILVSIGGGRFGHELLECVIKAAPSIEKTLPHTIQMFTGPFMPDSKFNQLQTMAKDICNLNIKRYTPNLLQYMCQADISISMSGYNTTMNILTSGVRAMILPFTGNDDREQKLRATKLEKLGVVDMIRPKELEPDTFLEKLKRCLQKQPNTIKFDFNGVEKTAVLLNKLVMQQKVA